MKRIIVLFILIFVTIGYSQQDKDFGKVKLKNKDKLTKEITPYYNYKVQKNKYFSRVDSTKMKYKIEKNGKFVDFEIKDETNKVMELYFTDYGIKEIVTISSGNAGDDSIVYTIDANILWSIANGQIVYYEVADEILYTTPEITADYFDGVDTVDVLQSFYKLGNKLIVKFDGSLGYPVIIDPSISFNNTNVSSQGWVANSVGANDAARRSSPTGNQISTTDYHYAGLQFNTKLFRGFIKLSIPNISLDTMSIDSVVINFAGVSGNLTAGKFFGLYAAPSLTTLDVNTFNNFEGWVAGDNPYTGANLLSDSVEFTTYVSGYPNYIRLNSKGIDSLKANINDTLRLALLTTYDVSNTLPATDHFQAYEAGYDVNPPILTIYYSYPTSPTITSTATDTNQLYVAVSDTVSLDTMIAFKIVTLGKYIDSVGSTSLDTLGSLWINNYVDTVAWSPPNKKVVLESFKYTTGWRGDVGTSILHTLATPPSIQTNTARRVAESDSIFFYFSDSNPDTTRMAIYSLGDGMYIDTLGNYTSEAFYLYKYEWISSRGTGGDTIAIPEGRQALTFTSIALNEDSVETIFGDTTVFGAVLSVSLNWTELDTTLTWHIVDSAYTTASGYAIELNGTVILDSSRDSTGTIIGLLRNTGYTAKAIRVDVGGVASLSTASDTIFTDLPDLISPTVTFDSDTTFRLSFDTTGIFSNIGAYFAIGDSDLINKGSTRVFGSNVDSMRADSLFFPLKNLFDSTFKRIVKHTAYDTMKLFFIGISGTPAKRVK